MIALRSIAGLVGPHRSTVKSRCEVCAGQLEPHHRHVVEIGLPGVLCACASCSILFSRDDSLSRFRTIPDRTIVDPGHTIRSERWAALGIPVGLAFVVRRSTTATASVCYPGPAGVVDADLESTVWDELAVELPLVTELADDVEAVIVHGERGATELQAYLVPISSVYDLVSRLRRAWQGFTGGDEANRELARFFGDLEQSIRNRGAR